MGYDKNQKRFQHSSAHNCKLLKRFKDTTRAAGFKLITYNSTYGDCNNRKKEEKKKLL